jgi:hypothetical protein
MSNGVYPILFLLLAVITLLPAASCAERSVKVYQVGSNGELIQKGGEAATVNQPSLRGGREADEAISGSEIATPASRTRNDGLTVLIDDFEDEEPKNQMQGESGTWNLTPENVEVSISQERAVGKGAGESKGALKLSYDLESAETAKAGYWTKLRELDGRKYDHLVFDARGDSEQGFTADFVVELKRYKDSHRVDKLTGAFVVTGVTGEWQTIKIPLNYFTGLFDRADELVWNDPAAALRDLDELVISLESRRADKKTGALYFDNFRFVRTGARGPSIMDQPPRRGMKTPVRLEGLEYAKFLVKRLQGFPSKVVVQKEFPEDSRAFLEAIARDTWRFFDEIVDREHQLPLDTIQVGANKPLEEGAWIGDYTNVTNIGLYLMCLVSAYDLGFIPREDAVQRISATLATVEKLERHESGFLYNYYDTTTTERTEYFVSLVDSSWMDAGLYVVKNAFPEELKEQCERLLARHNFAFFYDEVEQQMKHGYYAHMKVQANYHYGTFYSEPRAASYLAIGRGEVPAEHWFRLIRTFPEEYGWQIQVPENRVRRTTLGFAYYGGYYQWEGMNYIPSWGGSMFEAIMPTMILDEAKYAPDGLGLNDRRHVEIQMRYALEELKYPVWGMSPSSVPEGGYSEYGAEPLGSKGYKAGVVTPHAAVLALEFAPEAAVQNLRNLVRLYPIYGEYGFYDAVNVKTGKVARKYLSLDQAMILVTLNNYLNGGAIRKRFHADAINQKALPLLTEEKLFETETGRETTQAEAVRR